jgi:hypothetical protein
VLLEQGIDSSDQGRVYGPFEAHEEMMKFFHSQTKKVKEKVKTKFRGQAP